MTGEDPAGKEDALKPSCSSSTLVVSEEHMRLFLFSSLRSIFCTGFPFLSLFSPWVSLHPRLRRVRGSSGSCIRITSFSAAGVGQTSLSLICDRIHPLVSLPFFNPLRIKCVFQVLRSILMWISCHLFIGVYIILTSAFMIRDIIESLIARKEEAENMGRTRRFLSTPSSYSSLHCNTVFILRCMFIWCLINEVSSTEPRGKISMSHDDTVLLSG